MEMLAWNCWLGWGGIVFRNNDAQRDDGSDDGGMMADLAEIKWNGIFTHNSHYDYTQKSIYLCVWVLLFVCVLLLIVLLLKSPSNRHHRCRFIAELFANLCTTTAAALRKVSIYVYTYATFEIQWSHPTWTHNYLCLHFINLAFPRPPAHTTSVVDERGW